MKKNNYFNEEIVQELLKEYQRTTLVYNNQIVSKNEILENKLIKEIEKIVIAIIYVYRYSIFEQFDDLKQEGLKACFSNFLKFDPKKGSAFDYFSIITKIHLLNYTDRRKKHRNHNNIDDEIGLECREEKNYGLFLEEVQKVLVDTVNKNYIGKTRKLYLQISCLIIDYYTKNINLISKSDLYSWIKSYGVKSANIREFINEMKKNNINIIELV